MQAAHFTINEPLNITIKGKSVILTPVKETEKIRLEDLLSGVTPQSVGGEHSWGSKVGAEIL